MFSKQFQQLISALLRATQKGEIRWEDAKGARDLFRVAFRGGSVVVGRRDDQCDLIVLNSSGQVAEGVSVDPTDPQEDIDLLFELWEAARRSARSTDETISDILKQLGDS